MFRVCNSHYGKEKCFIIMLVINVILAIYNLSYFSSVYIASFDEFVNAARRYDPIKWIWKTDQYNTTDQPLCRRRGTIQNHGDYWIIQNHIVGNGIQPHFDRSITLTTHGTHDYLEHVEVLCQRWNAPISMAIYAPGTDYEIVNKKLRHMLHCYTCTPENVTFHLVLDKKFAPTDLDIVSDLLGDDQNEFNCSAPLDDRRFINETTFKDQHKLPYPINVIRNAALTAARTKYVLASDSELYPSENIVPRKTCAVCQEYPDRDKWFSVLPNRSDTLGAFRTSKRSRARNSWEPIYVSTKEIPLFLEALTWEGMRDKMCQMYEMCLEDYDFYVLDNAFLCHAPGIKARDAKPSKSLNDRSSYMAETKKIESNHINYLRNKYKDNKKMLDAC